MSKPISRHLQNRLRQRFEELTGILLNEECLWRNLHRILQAISAERDFQTPEECADWLLTSPSSPQLVMLLAKHLTIGETHFFRDPEQLRMLSETILPEILHRCSERGRIPKIWHPCCATGEEPYTMAMLCNDQFAQQGKPTPSIFATDINADFLAKAREGLYTAWSFRKGFPPKARRYFQLTPTGRNQIIPSLRSMVRFAYLNLMEEVYPSPTNGTAALDLICCRNALMYFSPARAKEVINRFYLCLNEQGCLLLGACELPLARESSFTQIEINGITCLRKDSSTARKKKHQWPLPLPADPAPEEHGRRQHTAPSPSCRQRKPAPPLPLIDRQTPARRQSSDSTYQAALTAYGEGRYGEVATLLENLTTATPQAPERDGEIAMLLARTYANQGRFAKALQWCERLVTANRIDPAAYLLAGLVHQENGEPELAVRLFRQALYLDQDFIIAHYLLGIQLLLLGKEATARKHFATAAALLEQLPTEGILPESEGFTAGQLKAAITPLLHDHQSHPQGGTL